MIRRAIRIFRARGLSGLWRAAGIRLQTLVAGRARSFATYRSHFAGRSGMEIGGPSQVFSRHGIFPVYPLVERLDNCNFASATVWNAPCGQGGTFRFDPEKPGGRQYIAEATAMAELPAKAYDFVLSSHMLEHSANPVLALVQWKRLLKDDGLLVVLLPDKRYTFDHRRPVTGMDHLIADFDAGTQEDDLSHLPEILALHDLTRDPDAGDIESFKSRSLRNAENRCLHHHVFDAQLARRLVEHAGMAVAVVEELPPHHILLLARNISSVSS